jgi:hypothetical protein
MGVIYTKTDQGSSISSGTGIPTHSAVAGDYYTDTTTGFNYTYTTSWQKILSGAALTYFTEAQSTASPNATVPVDSLTAVASTTDADFAIVPKGAGAILCSIPNNIATVPNVGGNKRGQYALDLQRFGTSNAQTEVASGGFSVIVGGSRNTASGGNDTVLNGSRNVASGGLSTILNGLQNGASGTYSFIGNGQQNSASGASYATVINGYGNSTTGTYGLSGGLLCTAGAKAFAYGESCNAAGTYSISLGVGNTAGSDSSVALGSGANTSTTYGKVAVGGGGGAQKGLLVMAVNTTGNTPTVISWGGSDVDARANLTLLDNSLFRVKGIITGKQSASTNVAVWDIDYVIVRGVGVGTTAIVGIPTISAVTNIPSWGIPTITADTGRGYATIKVTGATTTNIRWVATLESTEVIYA